MHGKYQCHAVNQLGEAMALTESQEKLLLPILSLFQWTKGLTHTTLYGLLLPALMFVRLKLSRERIVRVWVGKKIWQKWTKLSMKAMQVKKLWKSEDW
jgi:hypothetical protein